MNLSYPKTSRAPLLIVSVVVRLGTITYNFLGMEKQGFIRVVDYLDSILDLEIVSTDRHSQIKKLMRTDPKYDHLVHQFDPWHMAKNLSKKLVKAGKRKGT